MVSIFWKHTKTVAYVHFKIISSSVWHKHVFIDTSLFSLKSDNLRRLCLARIYIHSSGVKGLYAFPIDITAYNTFWSNGCHITGPNGRLLVMTREHLLKGKAQYSWPPHWDSLLCKKEKIYFSLWKPADLYYLVQGGQLYWCFPFAEQSLLWLIKKV